MPWSLRWRIAIKQTLDPGPGLSAFLSRVSIVGMALAIALLLAVQSVMNGFDREMRDRILSLVPHIQITGKIDDQQWAALRDRVTANSSVLTVRAFTQVEALLMRGQSVSAAQLTGVDAELLTDYRHLMSPALVNWQQDSLVLGASMASRLDLELGDRVTFIIPGDDATQYQPLSVTLQAVLQSGTELDEVLAWVHRNALSPFLASSSGRQGLALQLDDVFDATQWRWQNDVLLPANLRMTDWRATHGNLYTAIQLSRDLIGLILFIVIFVAAFNIVSSLVLVVTDRRKAIAMLMAMGSKGSDITAIFCLQGVLIGVVGAVAGMVLGGLLAIGAPDLAMLLEAWLEAPLLQTDVYPLAFVPVDIRWQDFATTAMVAIGLSVIAAILPALRASSLPIAETLTH